MYVTKLGAKSWRMNYVRPIGKKHATMTLGLYPDVQWSSEYRNTIKEVKMNVGDIYTGYRVIFNKGVTYRGQPLEEYIFSFIPESPGSQNTLKFSSNANISTIMSNFQTRQVEYWGEMEDRGAIYSPKNKMVTCEFW